MDIAEKQDGERFLLVRQMQFLNFIVQIVLGADGKHHSGDKQAGGQNDSVSPKGDLLVRRFAVGAAQKSGAFSAEQKAIPQKVKKHCLARPNGKKRLSCAGPRLFPQKEAEECRNEQSAGDQAAVEIRGNFPDIPE